MTDTPPMIVLTRPFHGSMRFAQALEDALGARPSCVIAPVMDITPLNVSLDLTDDEWLIFTSENAVLSVDQDLSGRTAICVGPQTAATAQAVGCDVINIDGTAADVINYAKQHCAGLGLAHIRGQHTRGDIAQTLQSAGMTCRDIIAYDQTESSWTDEQLSQLQAADRVIFPVFSPRTCHLLIKQLNRIETSGTFVCISDATALPLKALATGPIVISAQPNGASMVDAVVKTWRDMGAT